MWPDEGRLIMAQPDTMLEHALRYGNAGFAVLPLAVRGKTPVTAHGKDDATTDPTIIRAWWAAHPRRNIGVRPPEGAVVLDVDPRAGGRLADLGEFDETWTAATGGGGWHLWFRYLGPVRSRMDGVAGVDIKTHRGYLVVPPSVHPSGVAYRWVTRAPIGPLPIHLRGRVRLPAHGPRPVRELSGDPSRRGAGLVRYVEQARPGHRNQALFWAAARAYAEGGDPKLLHDLVVAAAGVGLPDREIERTLRSAERTA
jgi:hypothetical protein